MQYDVKTPGEYIKALKKDWRLEKLQALRKILKANVPNVKEGINYKMLSYDYEGDLIFHLNAQVNHVGLYVCDAKRIDADGTLLKGIDHGKGCIRFKKSTEINKSNIEKLVAAAVKLSEQGVKSDC